MKVKMKENYQGVGQTAVLDNEGITVTMLEAGETYLVDASVGEYLVSNGKAEEVAPAYVKPQPKPEPEPETQPEEPVFKKRGRK